jgi:ABC-type branched-subunit amino acid transport system permease subunit
MVSWRYLFFGLALILVAVYRPQGLWPARRAKAAVTEEAA